MQIIELVIYGKDSKVRHLPFELGKVNIISGESKSGKSAVGDIIEYCLGGDSCNIADGVVRENAKWYGLLLKFDNENIFVARKNPEKGQQSTGYCYVQIGENIKVPEKGEFSSNDNVAGVEQLLSSRLGISENLNIPEEGSSRAPLSANIRHALYYCFQNQDEVAAKNFLFHRQAEDYITQSIRDTMPYFLGIINENALALEKEKQQLKRKITVEKRKLEENLMLQGGGLRRAVSLIAEAKQVGLLEKNLIYDNSDYDSMKQILVEVNEWRPIEEAYSSMNQLSKLQSKLSELQHKIDSINNDIDLAENFMGDTKGYSEEVEYQKDRLASIGLFEQLDFRTDHCPLCSGKLENELPNVDAIRNAIKKLDDRIRNVTREKPKLRKYIDELIDNKSTLLNQTNNLRAEIDGVYEQNKDENTIKELNSRRAKVVGRISLWLESVENNTDTEVCNNNIEQMDRRIKEIDKLLGTDSSDEKMTSVLSRISTDMTLWAKELELEHSSNPYRLDMNKVTVIVDKEDRGVPLKQLGSGSNWVGIHLITYLALHKYFAKNNRPVPGFLFIDQPSQVYFPSGNSEEDTDWAMVEKLYEFVIEKVNELDGKMQVIIVDHANLSSDKFAKLVIGNWRNGIKLIPEDWYIN